MNIFNTIMKTIAVLEILAIIVLIKIGGKLKEKRCNLKVKGKIVDKYTSNYDTYGASYKTFIIIEYEYKNEIFSTVRRVSAFSKYKPCDSVEIMINPNDPKETGSVLINRELTKKRSSKWDFIVALILLSPIIVFIGIIVFFLIGILLDKLNLIDFYSG